MDRPAPPPRPRNTGAAFLTLNGGSSSLKVALFDAASLERRAGADIEIGGPDSGRPAENLDAWLDREPGAAGIAAVGHRIVHGGVRLVEHQRVDGALIAELRRNVPLDLAHLPQEVDLIESISLRMPEVPQFACFDTAFHRDLPAVARLLPIPRRYTDAGFRRLGFHGLSYTYLLCELRRIAGDAAADGRVVLAHLGSGSSLAAVHRGRPVDTTMGFTPTGGLVMATRPGDLDPGLLVHLSRLENATPDRMDEMVNRECGLRGVSDTTSDMRQLLERRAADPRAAEAIALYAYQVRKSIGAFAAALGGLDTLVFSGGIGERSAVLRREIAAGLEFLGISLDPARNAAGAAVVSPDHAAVCVRVIATDEQVVIARAVRALMEEHP
jgi:acetate kinase